MSFAPNLLPPGEECMLSVGELNQRVRQHLEKGFPLLWVRGEVSNLTFHASGHVYFTLKDERAQVACVMFRSRAQLAGFRPTLGQRVEARALVTLYEAGGKYQLQVESLRPAGQGDLHARFIALRDRLAAAGVFAAERKRPLPRLPRQIGVITSPQGAALRDVVTTLRRRAPHVAIVVYPTPVQGAGAAGRIVAALQAANRRRECEVLILCRGGGSLEDLWSFNDEALAHALRASSIPVVCGVGHETDFTIADFAADLRAPTPTAAAELAAPDSAALLHQLAEIRRRLRSAVQRRLGDAGQRLDASARRLRRPGETLAATRRRLGELRARLQRATANRLAQWRQRLAALQDRHRRADLLRGALAVRRERLAGCAGRLREQARMQQALRRQRIDGLAMQLRALDPQQVVARGFAIVTDTQGRVLTDAGRVELNAAIHVNLRDGLLDATVTQIHRTQIPHPPED